MKKLVNNTAHVKQANIELVRTVLRKERCGTRANIANKTGLSVATCGNILSEMVKTGEIFEAELEESNGGRPARCFQYNADFLMVLSIVIVADCGQKSIRYEVCNMFGERVKQEKIIHEVINFDTIECLVRGLIEKYVQIMAVGIGVPGVTTTDGDIVTCDIPELENIKLRTELLKICDKEIIVENETHCTAYGFYKRCSEVRAQDSISVLIVPKGHHHGVGTVVGGQILRGYSHLAGEVSLIIKEKTRAQMLEDMEKSEDILVGNIVDAVISVIAIVNPAVLVLTGSGMQKRMMPKILELCSAKVSDVFLPKFDFREEDYFGYMEGIKELTMQKTQNNIMLIKNN